MFLPTPKSIVIALLFTTPLWALVAPARAEIITESDVFVGGEEGPQGTSNYRIPGMTVAPDGSILAFAEGRRSATDPGAGGFPIDLVMKRSTDGGATWSALVVLESNPAFDYDDPTPVVDAATGDVHLLYGRVPDDCGLFCVPPGVGDNSMNIWQLSSSDNGQTWGDPVNLTSQVKDPAWRGIVPGPGSGIQLHWQDDLPARNGRLVVPGSINANRNLVFYSDDRGSTWQSGNLAQDDLGLGNSLNGNENEVVELTNGDLLLNARQSGGSSRRMFRSRDGGDTWIESFDGPSPITTVDASMIRFSAVRAGEDRDRIVFSGPFGSPAGSGSGRSNIGVWTSYDEGRTFINPVQIEEGFAAYSVLGRRQDGTIGLLYEATGSTRIRYIGFDLAHLEGADHPSTMRHYDGFGNQVDPFRGGVGWSGSWNNNGVDIREGRLEFPGFFTAGDQQHAHLRGANMSRNLGSGSIDLNQTRDYYFSIFIQHETADGSDSGSEFLNILLKDDSGSTLAAFGVGSSENFFVNDPGGIVTSDDGKLARNTTYLLLAKIAAQDDSGNFDQVFLSWYDDPANVPADEAQVSWQLTGQASENLNATIAAIEIAGGTNADWLVDGLRIGTTFDSVIVDTGVVPPAALGDLNADGVIDLADWLIFRGNMNLDTSELGVDDRPGVGDFDASGLIDPTDFLAFVDLYDTANGDGAFAALGSAPEPSSLVLLVIGITLLGGWRDYLVKRPLNAVSQS